MEYRPPYLDERDRALLESVEPMDAAQLTPQRVRELCAEQSIDRATAILYRSILRSSPQSVEILRQSEASDTDHACSDALLAVMPGAFHQDYPETGGDGRQLLALGERLGCRVERVPVGSFDV